MARIINFKLNDHDEVDLFDFFDEARARRRITHDTKNAILLMQFMKKKYNSSDTAEILYRMKHELSEEQEND